MAVKLENLEKKLNYKFENQYLLRDALTHKSFANENREKCVAHNERLEFLGDAVLDLIVSELLYTLYPDSNEGDLSKKRSSLVREESLSAVAMDLGMGSYIMLGRGETMSGGNSKSSILADAFEALVAALFLDGGMSAAEKVIKNIFTPLIDAPDYVMDFKSKLQEACQKEKRGEIDYAVIDESGPDHDKLFSIELKVGGKIISRGSGKNIKEAQQMAACEGLREIWGNE